MRSKEQNQNFWSNIKRPFLCLAPMANVTDIATRSMLVKYGKPDVMWTEFVSADGLISPGKDRLAIDLLFDKSEKPIVAQLFSANPEKMKKATSLVRDLGFDGIDINMGCPDRSVEKQGAGASMMKNRELALEILKSAREGWIGSVHAKGSVIKEGSYPRSADNIPISIKTRIGYSKIDLSWIEMLLKQNLPALTIHLRTRKEMSLVPAHWDLMKDIVKMRDEIQRDVPKKYRTLIIGNGDINSRKEALQKIKETGCDGVMIGRGIFGKPYVFAKKQNRSLEKPEAKRKMLLEHIALFEKHPKDFNIMKKHFKAYINGWNGAKELRVKLMGANSLEEVEGILES
jgi:tRNA-dihydrouridine synthase